MRRLCWMLAVAALVAGFAAGRLAHLMAEPHCPAEDSCAVDYRDGRWIITEVRP